MYVAMGLVGLGVIYRYSRVWTGWPTGVYISRCLFWISGPGWSGRDMYGRLPRADLVGWIWLVGFSGCGSGRDSEPPSISEVLAS